MLYILPVILSVCTFSLSVIQPNVAEQYNRENKSPGWNCGGIQKKFEFVNEQKYITRCTAACGECKES